MTSSAIELATFLPVTQCLNQLRYQKAVKYSKYLCFIRQYFNSRSVKAFVFVTRTRRGLLFDRAEVIPYFDMVLSHAWGGPGGGEEEATN